MFLWQVNNQAIEVNSMHVVVKRKLLQISKMILKVLKNRAGGSFSTTTWPKDIAMKMIRKISRKSLQNLQRDSCKRRRK
jgi:hypothetical protein